MANYWKPQSPLRKKGGDYFYPLTTADQVIMPDGSRLGGDFASDSIVIELLWENAMPTNVFGAQTLSLDLSAYDMALIYFRTHANTGTYQTYETSVIARIGSKHTALDHSETGSYFAVRPFTVSTTGIVFETAVYAAKYAATSMSGTNGLVPVAIYGIKGIVNKIEVTTE